MDSKSVLALKKIITEAVQIAVRSELPRLLSSMPQYAPQPMYYPPVAPMAPVQNGYATQQFLPEGQQPANMDVRKAMHDRMMNEFGHLGSNSTPPSYVPDIDVAAIPYDQREFLKTQAENGNAFTDLLAETAANMKPGEAKNFKL